MQGRGLIDRPGIAVEDEAARHVVIIEPVIDQVVGQAGRHKFPSVEVMLGAHAQRGAVGDVVPEQITGRDVRHAEVLRQPDGLGALARTRGTQQNDSHFRNPS